MWNRRNQLWALVVIQWLIGSVAAASDGVIEINHASALSGGVTPGDAPGYPVTLSQGGSYRLTGNLNSPIATGAIVIEAAMVTLDLGGFMVASTNVCSGYPPSSCAVSGGAAGIIAETFAGFAVVRNGGVRGMGGSCIDLRGSSSEVDQVRALGCGVDGISMLQGGASRVTRSFAGANLRQGIDVTDGSTVEDSEVRANGQAGIHVAGTRLPVQIARNRVFDHNPGFGLNLFGTTVKPIVTRNILSGNQQNFGGLFTSFGDNLCHNVFC